MTKEEYFNRQIRLWGSKTQNRLEKKSLLIVGAGGLGSSLAFGLGSSGIGRVDIVDFDIVSFSNIHRQIAFSVDDVGKYKAEVISKRLKDKNPFLKTTPYVMSFKDFILLQNRYDLIVDATDNLESRKEIDLYSKSFNTPWVYGSVEEFNGQVCFFDRASFNIFDTTTKEPLKGVHAPIVMHIASLQANLALRYLAELEVVKDKLYYLFFNKSGELVLQKFNMPV